MYRQVASPGRLGMVGRVVEEACVVLHRLRNEVIPAQLRALRDEPCPVETQLYVRPLVVVEQTPRTEHDLLPSEARAGTIRPARVSPDLHKALMEITSVFVKIRARTTIAPGCVVEGHLREEPKILTIVQVEVWHHANQSLTVVVLRSRTQHPVVEILVLRARF